MAIMEARAVHGLWTACLLAGNDAEVTRIRNSLKSTFECIHSFEFVCCGVVQLLDLSMLMHVPMIELSMSRFTNAMFDMMPLHSTFFVVLLKLAKHGSLRSL